MMLEAASATRAAVVEEAAGDSLGRGRPRVAQRRGRAVETIRVRLRWKVLTLRVRLRRRRTASREAEEYKLRRKYSTLRVKLRRRLDWPHAEREVNAHDAHHQPAESASEGRRSAPRPAPPGEAGANPHRRRPRIAAARSAPACGWWKCSSASRSATATTRNDCWPTLPEARRRNAARQRAGLREAGVRPAGGRRARRGRNAAAHACASFGSSPAPTVPLVAVLEGVEKPGNVGAVLRSADAAGVSAVIVADGANRSLQSQRDPGQLGHDLHDAGVRSHKRRGAGVAARTRSSRFLPPGSMVRVPYTEVDYRGPTAIVLGSEAAGLSSDLDRRRHPGHPSADARRGRQPERFGHGRRAVLRSFAADGVKRSVGG